MLAFRGLAVVLLLHSLALRSESRLNPNDPHSAQELKSIAPVVCAGRSSHCSVLIDVPSACAGNTTKCPIGFFYHGHNGRNVGFQRLHDPLLVNYGFIGVYPQGELYDGRSGWNDGSMDGNKCKWDDFSCQSDPNDGNFTRGIITTLRGLGAIGRVYLWGGSNGANAVQILAANAGSDLPIAGISAGWGQLMAKPPRSGPAPFDWNQPTPQAGQKVAGRPGDGRVIAQQAHHGDADHTIPYEGGPRFGSAVWILMPEPESDKTWASHNNCTGGMTNTAVDATYMDKGSSKEVKTVATYFQYHGCPDTAPVEYYQIHGAPHGGAKSIRGKDPFYIVFDFWQRVENASAHASPTPPPAPTPPSPSPDVPPAGCQKCVEGICGSERAKKEVCEECMQTNSQKCAHACLPFPFRRSEAWLCGGTGNGVAANQM